MDPDESRGILVLVLVAASIFGLGMLTEKWALGKLGPVEALPQPQPQLIAPAFDLSIVQGGAPIETNSSWSFVVADYDHDGIPDLWVIKRAHTGTNSTEIHILKGPKFDTFLLHTGTPLHETPDAVRALPLTAEKP